MPDHAALAGAAHVVLLDGLDCAPDSEELLVARNLADAAVEHGEAADEVEQSFGATQRVHRPVLNRDRALALSGQRVEIDARAREITGEDGVLLRRRKDAVGEGRDGLVGVFFIMPLGPKLRLGPNCRIARAKVDFVLDDRFIDLRSSSVDVSIRLGHFVDDQVDVLPLTQMRRLVLATPAYLSAFGRPEHPRDLSRHSCIIHDAAPGADVWDFASPKTGETIKVKVDGCIRSNAADATIAAIMCDLGVGMAPDWAFTNEISQGSVTCILEDYESPHIPINLVRPKRLVPTPLNEAFCDFLKTDFEQRPNVAADSTAALELDLLQQK